MPAALSKGLFTAEKPASPSPKPESLSVLGSIQPGSAHPLLFVSVLSSEAVLVLTSAPPVLVLSAGNGTPKGSTATDGLESALESVLESVLESALATSLPEPRLARLPPPSAEEKLRLGRRGTPKGSSLLTGVTAARSTRSARSRLFWLHEWERDGASLESDHVLP